jgi:putative nucleotidyltransferase with HDIG domain
MAVPQELIRSIGHLAPMPVTAQRILSVLNDEDVSLAEIAAIVEYDEALVANTLRVANSVFHARSRPVTTIRAAVVRLGSTNLFNLILGRHLRSLATAAPLYDLSENDLWMHSAVAALAAEEILTVSAAEIPQLTKIAALVHDVGKLIMVRYFKCDFRGVLERADRCGISFVEAERELLGCDHAEVGAAVARHWGFPEPVTYAIEYHHSPAPEPSPVLDVVIMANLVAKTLATGLGAEGMNFTVDEGCRKRLQLDFNSFCRICARVEEGMHQVKSLYGVA